MSAAEVEIVTAYRCLECAAVVEEPAEGSLYECSRCGDIFTQETSADGESNRCAGCNIFGAKLADDACPECNAGELEEVRAFLLEGELVPLLGDGTEEEQIAAALQKVSEEKQADAERKQRRDDEGAAAKDRFERAPLVPASDLKVGDVIILDMGEGFDHDRYRPYRIWKLGSLADDMRRELGNEPVPSGKVELRVEEWRWDEWHPSSLGFTSKPDSLVRRESEASE